MLCICIHDKIKSVVENFTIKDKRRKVNLNGWNEVKAWCTHVKSKVVQWPRCKPFKLVTLYCIMIGSFVFLTTCAHRRSTTARCHHWISICWIWQVSEGRTQDIITDPNVEVRTNTTFHSQVQGEVVVSISTRGYCEHSCRTIISANNKRKITTSTSGSVNVPVQLFYQ